MVSLQLPGGTCSFSSGVGPPPPPPARPGLPTKASEVSCGNRSRVYASAPVMSSIFLVPGDENKFPRIVATCTIIHHPIISNSPSVVIGDRCTWITMGNILIYPTHRYIYIYMYGWMDGCMDVWMYGCMDVMDEMDGWMDEWMNECM